MATEEKRATSALADYTEGDTAAADRLLPLVYGELRALAARYLAGERPGNTLQPTALVHEAYLRLVDVKRMEWRGKTHFFAMAATQMRRILIDRAAAKSAAKRGNRPDRVTLGDGVQVGSGPSVDLIALDQALTRLESRSDRQARVAELRLFAGLTVRETAFALGVSERTVKGDWRVARAWLMRELSPEIPT